MTTKEIDMMTNRHFLSLLKNKNYTIEHGIVKYKIENSEETNLNKECYDKIASKFKNFWEEIEDWQLTERKKFKDYLSKNPVVLDLGCGQGRDLKILATLGLKKLVGIDISMSQLMLAKQRRVAKLVHSNFETMPFEDEVFDGAWSCVTLLHVARGEMDSMIKKVKRILKKDGIFFISLQEGIGKQKVERDIYDNVPMIIHYYKPDEIQKILKNNGFEILDYERFHKWKGIKDRERIFFNFYCRRK